MSDSLTVRFYNAGSGFLLKYVVITARYNNKWVFVRNSKRGAYEIPGGHIEPGEDALTAAKRELYEETGALEFDIYPVSIYAVERETATSAGMLFFADIKKIGELPSFEITEVMFSDVLPQTLSFPLIQPELHKFVEKWLDENHKGN